jgi:tetrahydromethanopterin S-methyltransferase subunit B
MTGSVLYSVEIYDAQSNQLLESYVTKQFPNSENVFATAGSLTAAKTGIDKGANTLVKQLD